MSCTSKWRWPSVRLAASRTTAKASGSRSSRVSPLARRSRNSAVLARSCLVGELGELRLERIDLRHRLVEAFDDAIIGGAEQASGQRAEHENLDILMT